MSKTIRQRRERLRRASRRRARLFLLAALASTCALAGTLYGVYDYLKGDDAEWPSIKNLQPQRIGQNSLVLSADGKRMGFIQSDQNRTILPYPRMGQWVPRATVAIEDRRFYQHNGVDPEGMARALSVNLEAGDSKEGASTITQQVVRNLYKEITTEKTVRRKAKEATLAVELEKKWNKEKILETYLNLVFYGNNAYGIEAASQTYFNKPSKNLAIAEAALLSGLPQQPSEFDPFNPKKAAKAKARRADVLQAMHAQKMITTAEYDTALASPIKLSPGKVYKVKKQPYFFDYVEQELIKQFGAATVRQGGLKIKTTIDPELQRLAEQAIKDKLYAGPSAAIAVLDTKTGQIKAMAGSASYSKSRFNLSAQAVRQPGSTAKIWVLSAFVLDGIDPDATTYTSRPFRVRYRGSPDYWEPKTYSGSYAGSMSVRRATVASDNSVYAQMTLDITPEKVAAAAHRLGITSKLENVWSIGLGSQVVTPLEQTSFYSTIARGGARIDPRAVSEVITPGGTDLPLKYPKGRRVMKDWQADKIVSILQDNVRGGTGTRANIPGKDVSGKTGTTDDAKDAWFCGMTPELTACVWMGYYIPTPMNEAGGQTPASIWRAFMEPALNRVPDRDWFKAVSEPVWMPYSSGHWKDDPGLETTVGADPTAKPTDAEDKEDKADKAEVTGVTPAPTTPPPTTPVTPEPVTPVAPVTPTPTQPVVAPPPV